MIRFGAIAAFAVLLGCQPAWSMPPPARGRARAPEAERLRDLVRISSGTANVAGVNAVQEQVAADLKRLGFEVQFKANPRGEGISGKLLVATLRGTDPRFITLVTHADTVFESPGKFEVSDDATIARGPGVIDAKGGTVVALRGLSQFLARAKPRLSIRFISSPSEETGSAGFLDDFRRFARDSVMVLGFEPALDNGSIIDSRRGDRWYAIRVTGKEAHAGRAHADGVNACHELSIKLDRIQRLTDYAQGVTASIGRIEGGQDKYNIVCGWASAKIDTRFLDVPSRDALHEQIQQILNEPIVRSARGETAATTFELEDDCPPLAAHAASKLWIGRYLEIVKTIEKRDVRAERSDGAADLNYFSVPNVILLDGLGARGGKMHTNDEFVHLDSLASRARALHEFLARADREL